MKKEREKQKMQLFVVVDLRKIWGNIVALRAYVLMMHEY